MRRLGVGSCPAHLGGPWVIVRAHYGALPSSWTGRVKGGEPAWIDGLRLAPAPGTRSRDEEIAATDAEEALPCLPLFLGNPGNKPRALLRCGLSAFRLPSLIEESEVPPPTHVKGICGQR